jgi:hypothetical protein
MVEPAEWNLQFDNKIHFNKVLHFLYLFFAITSK